MAESQIEEWWGRNENRVLWAAIIFLFSSNQTIKSENKKLQARAIEVQSKYEKHLQDDALAGFRIAARNIPGADSSAANRGSDSAQHAAPDTSKATGRK